jgi:hypothetical protein
MYESFITAHSTESALLQPAGRISGRSQIGRRDEIVADTTTAEKDSGAGNRDELALCKPGLMR